MNDHSTPAHLLDIDPSPLVARLTALSGAGGSTVDPDIARRLDWGVLCESIAEHCALEKAADVARRLPLFDSQPLIERRMYEVLEVASLIRAGDRPRLRRLKPIGDALQRARREAILDATSLLAVYRTVKSCNEIRDFFRRRRAEVPLCWQIAGHIASLDELERTMSGLFDETGQLADDASPDLRSLRKRVRKLHDSMRSEIDGRLSHPDVVAHLQDDFYTLRDGRYVLPIKIGARGRVPGIVHDTSASGQTVFVEPADLVDLNNRLRLSELDVRDEELRILRNVSTAVGEHADDIEGSLERLVYVDLLRACADLSVLLGAERPRVGGDRVALHNARHPVLLLRAWESLRDGSQAQNKRPKDLIVANDIIIEPEAPILVVSGANAGGKTVTLKTVGLFSLMVRAGLPLPADPDSEMPVFGATFTDIGDEQSIVRDTSTFSAHLENLGHFLPDVDDKSLVLLDEPFSGTDPAYAAVLTIALIEDLRRRGSRCVITTHLDQIKAWTLEQEWAANASVRFDVEELRPTYELQLGVPGGSSALAIARRLGFDEGIVARAEALRAGDHTSNLETTIQRLEAERRGLENDRKAAHAAEAEATARHRQLERELARVRDGEIDALADNARAARDEVELARAWLRDAMKYLRKTRRKSAGKLERGREVAAATERVARKAQAVVKEARHVDEPGLSPDDLKLGLQVWSRTYRKAGEVVGIDMSGNATLQLGLFKVTVPAADLRLVKSEPAPRPVASRRGAGPKSGPAPSPAAGEDVLPLVPQSPDNTCDLRGMTSDEALERLDLFLDSATLRTLPTVYVIHGHGTGVLKRAVRANLTRSPYIKTSRPGERGEGGDGVTVAWLK